MTTSEATQGEWGFIREAVEAGGPDVNQRHVRLWAKRGLISVRRIPGMRPMYRLADVKALASRFTQQAAE